MTQKRRENDVLLRLLCSKARDPHVLGTVRPGRDGQHLVEFHAAMRADLTTTTSAPMTAPLTEIGGFGAYCPGCRKRFTLVEEPIRDAIARHIPRLTLETTGFLRDPRLWQRKWGQR